MVLSRMTDENLFYQQILDFMESRLLDYRRLTQDSTEKQIEEISSGQILRTFCLDENRDDELRALKDVCSCRAVLPEDLYDTLVQRMYRVNRIPETEEDED